MVALPLDKFYVDHVAENEGYVDVTLLDKLPKGVNRIWRVTRKPDGGHYSCLWRASNDEADFNEGVMLPQHMTVALVMWLTFEGVW